MPVTPIGGVRLALLFPLFCCLVVIDDKAHWAALWLYLASVLAGAVDRRLAPAGASADDVGAALLTLSAMMGLAVGAAATIGPAGAAVVMVGRVLFRQALARVRPAAAAAPDGKTVMAERALSLLTTLGFLLMIAPWIPGAPAAFESHRVGGGLFMAGGVLALVLLGVELVRGRNSGSPDPV